MGVCEFIDILNKLRRSSSDAIDNIEKFDDFKYYMHVPRRAEKDLKDLLGSIQLVEQKKLVLLCGSAGDGKSHLLSYLRNVDHLLDSYDVYNDATESNAPTKTAVETLNEVLDGFSDEKLDAPGRNVILAINLGVLSNFIESTEYGGRFLKLRKYVEKNSILDTNISNNKIELSSPFQHISFADYHMFTLTEDGAKTDFIEALLDKIFQSTDNNIFYSTYLKQGKECPLAGKCPVKNNYEFMQNTRNRKYVAQLLVQAIIKKKVVLTTREILNFVYDIMVSSDFNYYSFYESMINKADYLKMYIENITPMLLFERKNVTPLLDILSEYDPLLVRNEAADDFALSFYVSRYLKDVIVSSLEETSYLTVLGDDTVIEFLEKSKNENKRDIFKILTRIKWMNNYLQYTDDYNEYIKDLYYFNVGKIQKLSSLYSKIEKAVYTWCGAGRDKTICLDDSHVQYSLYEKIRLEPSFQGIPEKLDEKELVRFLPKILVGYKKQKDQEKYLPLDIDFSLYQLICKLNNGYMQTADDKSSHADFVSFINQILKNGDADEKIIIKGLGVEALLMKDPFWYKFEVRK